MSNLHRLCPGPSGLRMQVRQIGTGDLWFGWCNHPLLSFDPSSEVRARFGQGRFQAPSGDPLVDPTVHNGTAVWFVPARLQHDGTVFTPDCWECCHVTMYVTITQAWVSTWGGVRRLWGPNEVALTSDTNYPYPEGKPDWWVDDEATYVDRLTYGV